MEAKFFKDGSYIYECKTSPSKMGDYFSTSYLKSAINDLEQIWERGSKPSGYRYVFPVNYLDDQGKTAIENLKSRHPQVDIRYYDCDQVQKLVDSLAKVNTLPELVEYINQARGK